MKKDLGEYLLRGLYYDSRVSANRVGEVRNPYNLWL